MPAKLSRHLDGLQTDATCAVVAFSMHKFCHARSFLPSLSICSGKQEKKKKNTAIKLSRLHLILIKGGL